VNEYPAPAGPGNRLLFSTMGKIGSSVCGPIFVDTMRPHFCGYVDTQPNNISICGHCSDLIGIHILIDTQPNLPLLRCGRVDILYRTGQSNKFGNNIKVPQCWRYNASKKALAV
jgi:hypothetical protein